jgi:uncharacterized protein (TIGR03435 family)
VRMWKAILPVALLLPLAVQSGDQPEFEAADVHAASPTQQRDFMRGPFVRKGRMEIRNASIVDLVAYAYKVDTDKVLGGPNWLEFYRYDVIAQPPANTTQENLREMVQSLLADRFKLVAKPEVQPVSVLALRVGKKLLLKPTDGPGEPGCKMSIGGMTLGPNTGPIKIGPDSMFEYNCHSVTMESFAGQVRGMNGSSLPVVDQTELKGAWDFGFKYSLNFNGMQNGGSTITFTEALDKQVGLKLEAAKAPMPVILVESAKDKPTANAPNIAELLHQSDAPDEFEVAVIKPLVDEEFRGMQFQNQPGGRITMRGYTLKQMILQAWNVNADMLLNVPKFAEQDRYEIVAKVSGVEPGAGGPRSPSLDNDVVWGMVKKLLADRFGLKAHMEERTLPAYTLLAAKPKMKKADPNERMSYHEGTASPDAKDPRDKSPVLSRLVTCQNLTMAQFAQKLQGIAPGYIKSPVLDATGLEGSYDFTLSFSPVGAAGRAMPGPAPARDAAPSSSPSGPSAIPDTVDPNGAITLFEAMEKQLGLKLELQKRPIQVLVIDHLEQKPTDN